MSQQVVSYNKPDIAGEALAVNITASETTMLEITDFKYTQKSQLTAYIDAALGDHTSVQLRYYYGCGRLSSGNIVYYEIPVKNLSTGVMSDTPTVINSTSPFQTPNYRFIEDIPMSGADSFKITAKGIGGTSGTMNSVRIFVRDN